MASAKRSSKFPIFVRFNSNTNIPVQADPQWNVLRLKQEIAEHQAVDPREIRIIFAGKELKDDLKVKDADIPNQSVIHAIRGRPWSARSGRDLVTPLSKVCLATVGEEEEEEELEATTGVSVASARGTSVPKRKAQYFVYCKSVCKDITPGKLRVCCSRCNEGAMVLYQGPSSWDDVLKPRRIRGSCKTPACNGDTAVFFFKCARHPAAEGDRCVALPLIHSNTRDIICITCTEIKESVLVFPCPDKHAMCLDCFGTYCTVKLNDRQFVQTNDHGYTLPCPGTAVECTRAFITEAHHFRVLEKEQYDRYQSFAAEEHVLKEGGVLCPRPGCGMGLLPEQRMSIVRCSSCHLEFCKECKEPFQRGHSCCRNRSNAAYAAAAASARASRYQVNAENARRARWEADSQRVIERTSKKCPGCQANTEKNEGCNHMTCSRCKTQWCWICVKAWNSECQSSHWFRQ
ncbi:E3 ubiquitin-protein ligase parkin-like isoform X2 [Montipora capricornis]